MATKNGDIQTQSGTMPRGDGQMMLGNEQLGRTFHKLFNERKWDELLGHLSNDCTWEVAPMNKTFKGKQGYREICDMWVTACPDAMIDVKNVLVTNDRIVVEFVGRGKHTGQLKTPMGVFEATQKQMSLPYCDVMEVRGGKIVSARSYFDMNTLFMQMGLPPTGNRH